MKEAQQKLKELTRLHNKEFIRKMVESENPPFRLTAKGEDKSVQEKLDTWMKKNWESKEFREKFARDYLEELRKESEKVVEHYKLSNICGESFGRGSS